MTTFAVPNPQQFAYLSVLDIPNLGYIGGLLVIDHRGRPLEFHCTSPAQVSRAQQILFGTSLEAHIHVDCIGAALVDKLSRKPAVLFVRQPILCEVAEQIETPAVVVDLTDRDDDESDDNAVDGQLAVPSQVRDVVDQLARHVELGEPFQRIDEAIQEAHALVPLDAEDPADAA